MLFVASLLAVSATAIAPFTVLIHKSAPFHLSNVPKQERHAASAKSAIHRFSTSPGSAPLENVYNFLYRANATVGNGQILTVDLDTGSSDVWVRGAKCTASDGSCDGPKVSTADSSLKSTGKTYSITYGSGSCSGDIYTGPVAVGSAVASNLPFGVSTSEKGLAGVADGLLGLGYNGISTISQQTGTSANWFDALGFSGATNKFAFYLSDAPNGDNGEVTFGGVDTSKYTGAINYLAVNSQTYWQFDVSKATYSAGSKSGGLGGFLANNAISDTGTSLIILGTSQADAINQGIGAKPYNSTLGAYYIDCGIAKTGPSLDFKFPSFTLSVPAKYYVLDNGDGTCISGVTQGAGFLTPSIFGDVLSRAYYTIYDKANNKVGFAKAVHPQ
ncbi:Vacuolar protease A [Boothiomyces sp. JEL0866]|nr:Vacuolar protease A [Boothiomyces sp. JEL0866]